MAEQSGPENEQTRKIFLGGLSSKTDEASLKRHFADFGDIEDCCVIRTSGPDSQKRSRGFGFVTFTASKCVDAVMDSRVNDKITIDDKEVEVKRAVSRADAAENPSAKEKIKKVFVGGIGHLTEEQLQEFFSTFGTVTSTAIPQNQNKDSKDNKRRGFAFVTFDDYDVVDKVVAIKIHKIDGVSVECKKARPPGQNPRGGPGGRRNDFNGYGGGNFGSNYGTQNSSYGPVRQSGGRYGGGQSGGPYGGNFGGGGGFGGRKY